jgi:sulfide:quinone oxidoreductase
MRATPATHLRPGRPRHVVVAGGGFAAVEALLALRALAGPRVTLELIAPDDVLRYQPSATGEPFGADVVSTFPLAEVAGETDATFVRDGVEAIAPAAHTLRLASGATRRYDGLVLAFGARRRVGVPGAVTFRGQRDVHLVRDVLDGLLAGDLRRVVYTAPVGASWTLPVYELALMTARRLDEAGVPGEVTVVTPEHRPLDVFGDAASAAVGGALAEQDVRLITGAQPREVLRDRLELSFGAPVAADRVVAVPRLTGPRVTGLPGDWNGFVATDTAGRVRALTDVYAAGDLTTYPVKQGGLAAQQAESAAADIARRLGADVSRPAAPRVLRATLLGPGEPLYLRAELDADGRPLAGATASDELPWWPSGKVVGRYLSPYLAQRTLVAAA